MYVKISYSLSIFIHFHFLSFFLSLTPVKHQLITLNPPVSTTAEAITMNQQQLARTADYMKAFVCVQTHMY